MTSTYSVASDAALLLSILAEDDVAMQAIARACLPNLTPTQFLPAFYASLSGRKAVCYTLNNHHPSNPRNSRVFQVWMEGGLLRWRWLSPYTQHKPSRHEFITTVSRIRRVVMTTMKPLSGVSGELTHTGGAPSSGGVPLQYVPGD